MGLVVREAAGDAARVWRWAVRDGRYEPDLAANYESLLDSKSGRLLRPAVLAWTVEARAIAQACEGSELLRKLEWLRCKRSLWYFLTKWCYAYDTLDEENPVKPFPSFKYLKDVVDAYVKGGPLFVEKSRQMFLSWLFAGIFLWELAFNDGFSALMMSWRQDRTDDGGQNSTPESLFGKIRWIWLHLPEWLRPPLVFAHRKIRHATKRDRWISGETAGTRSGRGGTYKRAFLDELAHYEHSTAAYHAIKLACPRGLIACSTPNGKGNQFWILKSSETSTFRKVRVHWSAHPARRAGLYKDEDGRLRSPWYDLEARDMTDAYVAQELDISYERSKHGAVYHSFQLSHIVGPDDIKADRAMRILCGMDFGERAGTAAVWTQTDGDVFEIFDYHGKTNASALYWCEYFAWMLGECQDEKGATWIPSPMARKFEHLWGLPGQYANMDVEIVGDPAGRKRESDHKSWLIRLAEGSDRLGGPDRIVGAIECRPVPRTRRQAGIQLLLWLIERDRLKVRRTANTEPLITAFTEYCYPTDEAGEVTGTEPVHDKFSHPMDATRYAAIEGFWTVGGTPLSASRLAA